MLRRTCAVIAFGWLLCVAPATRAAQDLRKHGEYLFRAAGCATCHTNEKNRGAPLAGGGALKTPFGVFYTPNITPDPETGIGRWSEADFTRALRAGVSPEGQHYYPAFPYPSYARMRDEDVRVLWAYLSKAKPVRRANKPHELLWFVRYRPLLGFWKALFFRPGPYQSRSDRTEIWNRGAYLANAVGHCGECHTPRNLLGGMKERMAMAGTRAGPEGDPIPNLTPHKTSGIGRWRESDLMGYFDSGMMQDGDFAGDIMAQVVDNTPRHPPQDDRRAIAGYILSLPPVDNPVRKEKKNTDSDF